VGRFLDLQTWRRREHYELFRAAVQPFFAMTVELDVTRLRDRCDGPDKPSFFLSALYACLRAASDTEAFRLRLRPEGVWLHDSLGVTSTVLRDDDTFAFVRIGLTDTLEQFLEQGQRELKRARDIRQPLDIPPPGDDALLYHSTIPWLRFTAFTNAIGKADDSVPRVVFGRCTREGPRATMPVSVEVHHAVADGLDVARFIERLQHNLVA
jgi:chloramphenicol O-acetyltransferase type A